MYKESNYPVGNHYSKSMSNQNQDALAAEEFINLVQQKVLKDKRNKAIDEALDERNEERFNALTSPGWEALIS